MAYRKNADRDEDKAKAYELEQVHQRFWHKPAMLCFMFFCLFVFHRMVVVSGVLALLPCVGSGTVFPVWNRCFVPLAVSSVCVPQGGLYF